MLFPVLYLEWVWISYPQNIWPTQKTVASTSKQLLNFGDNSEAGTMVTNQGAIR